MINKEKKILTKFILNQPFFAILLLRLVINKDSTCKTAYTDGRVLAYNPDFLDKLSFDESVGLFAHEVMHVALMHHLRREYRNKNKWNAACDYEINILLKESGFTIPSGGLIDYKFKDHTAEWIYDQLPDSFNNENNASGFGEVRDYPGKNGSPTKAEKKKEEQKWKGLVVEAKAVSERHQSNVSAGLDRAIKDLTEQRVHWRSVLARFFDENSKLKFNWDRPNKRYMNSGIYMPSRKSKELGGGIIFCDTSGSVTKEEIISQVSEIHSILTNFKIDIYVVYVDSKVCGVDRISSNEYPFELKPKGGGGTSFKPGFNWVDDQGIIPKWAIYFTDGACNNFPDEPDFPVVWVLNEENKFFKPPFGEIVRMVNE